MTFHIIRTDAIPAPDGPCSQAVRHDGLILTSQLIGVDARSGELAAGSHAEQAHRCLCNLQGLLEAGGSSLAGILKLTLYVTDLQVLPEIDRICVDFFPVDPPARGVVEVRALPRGALVAVEAIAVRH
jgi:2-iminobutanoate/2-iminopropanoate deaminase